MLPLSSILQGMAGVRTRPRTQRGASFKYSFLAILLLKGAVFGFILLNSVDFSNQSWFGFQLHGIICFLKDYNLKLSDCYCYYLSGGPEWDRDRV